MFISTNSLMVFGAQVGDAEIARMKTIEMRSKFVDNPDYSGTQFKKDDDILSKFERSDYRCAMWHLLARHWHKQLAEGFLETDQLHYLQEETFDMETAIDEVLDVTGKRDDFISLKDLMKHFRVHGYTRKAQGDLKRDMERHFRRKPRQGVCFKNHSHRDRLVGALLKPGYTGDRQF